MNENFGDTLSHIHEGGRHAVAASLRVLIKPAEDGGYVAQGLEIDYVASGQTIEEAQDTFVHGLVGTVEAYLRRGRSLDGLFEKSRTPAQAWAEWFAGERRDTLDCVSVMDLNLPADTPFFKNLTFCRPSASAA